jgi:phosphoglycerate dehydrogenase-like enzyme
VKVLVPATFPMSGLPHEVVEYDPQALIPAEHSDAEVLVVRGNSSSNLRDASERLRGLRLVQSFAAGTDPVEAAGFTHVIISSGRSLHDRTVSEHVLALMLALYRGLPSLSRAQSEGRWDEEHRRAQADPITARRFTLHDSHVVIWGFGSIAAALAPLLEALGARITGVASEPGERFGRRVVGASSIDDVLPAADALVSLLPHTVSTEGLIDARVFDALPDHAIFVNAGRGATVDETALRSALERGTLRAAALDVTRTEPLPADDPLWRSPNLIITPHVAGGRPQGAEALLRENLAALAAGTPLRNVVNRRLTD